MLLPGLVHLLIALCCIAVAAADVVDQTREDLLVQSQRLLVDLNATIAALNSAKSPAAGEAASIPWNFTQAVEVHPQGPKVYVIDDFLDAEECRYVQEQGARYLEPSTLVGASGGEGLRQSQSAIFPRSVERSDPKIRKVLHGRASGREAMPLPHC